LYLIDAGANILHSLRALGIGVSEIEASFTLTPTTIIFAV